MATPFQVEAWTEYAIGLLVLLVRIVYRSTIVGTNWEGDDYFALIAVFFWTGELVMLELIGQYGSITGMTDEIALTLSDKQIERIVVGSKCLLAGWILYVTLIWCLKACMLFLYRRLTLNLTQRRMVYITACTCAVLYIVTIIVILTRCQPFHANWQVYPYPGDACALNIPNYIALAITNVTTDMMILYIPLPLLWSVQMPMARKIICSLWLCTGVFIIIATLLRCILCLQDAQSINLGTIWSIRETNRSKTGGQESANHIVTIGAKESTHRLDRLTKDGRRGLGWTEIDNDSEERIMKTQNDVAVSAKRSDEELNREVSPNGIHVKTTFQVSG
ncbi:hypothetical protein K4K56_008113 [Colletotrichum sp. SAR 10_98]|nr:hypothetical protein K4K56_008113 [Colletotrichum sp. SAR 10_98]